MKIILDLPIDNDFSIAIMSRYATDLNIMYGYSGELFVALKHENNYLKLSSAVTLWDLESMLDHCREVSMHKVLIPLALGNWEQISISYHTYWEQVSSGLLQGDSEWIGSSLKLLECNAVGLKSCITFLYNTNNQDIEFLITTKYPWFFPLKKVPMTYKTWLKHYKVLHRFKISQQIIQSWIFLLQPLCTQLRKNVDEIYSSK